jgi:hypothetical protein
MMGKIMADVATSKLLENDKIIVWELVLEPGESTGVHTHQLDYMVHVIEGSTLRATDGNGENASDVPLADNDTFYFSISGGIAEGGELQTTTTHDAKNIGPGRYREIMVEIK